MRTNLFINCLDAVKNFFNRYLQLPATELRSRSVLEKGQLAHAMVVLVRLPFCTNTGLETSVWQRACDVESYLEALSDRVGRSHAETETHESLSQFRDSVPRIRAWYQRMLYFGTPGTPTGLKTTSHLELVEITGEKPILDMNLSGFDFSGMDML